MQCDICSKNDATVHLTEIVDNKISKLHLCEDCAKKKGAEMEEHFGLSDLLAGLADFEMKAPPKKEVKVECSKCGMTYDDFKKAGRLGCGNCYATFKDSLEPLIKRIHGSAEHVGKAPAPAGVSRIKKATATKKPSRSDKLTELKVQLERAIKLEEFETAARLRDSIREFEKRATENTEKRK